MQYSSAEIEPVTKTDILNLATWNRPRSTAELQDFLARHATSLTDDEIFS